MTNKNSMLKSLLPHNNVGSNEQVHFSQCTRQIPRNNRSDCIREIEDQFPPHNDVVADAVVDANARAQVNADVRGNDIADPNAGARSNNIVHNNVVYRVNISIDGNVEGVADAVVGAHAEFHDNANAVRDAVTGPNAGGTGSGRGKGMAPERLMIFDSWHYHGLGKKYYGKLQLEYKPNEKFYPYSNYDRMLPSHLFYTDDSSCAMDGFNLGIGMRVLTRKKISVPYHPNKGISYDQMRPTIKQEGYALDKLYVKKSSRKSERNAPSFKQVLAFKSGVYLCKFYWKSRDTGQNDYHVVAVNCDQRHVFCNTLGVIPFAARQVNESQNTHDKVSTILRNPNVFTVYRIIERK